MTTTQKRWQRSLGTSKRDQGIITPKDPTKRNRVGKAARMRRKAAPVKKQFTAMEKFFAKLHSLGGKR